jgi:hypothetical protein
MSSVSINSEDCSATPRDSAGHQLAATQAGNSSSALALQQQQQAGVPTSTASAGNTRVGPSISSSLGAKQQAELAACQVQLGSQFEAVHDYLVRVHKGG